jgi:hypothetical protein
MGKAPKPIDEFAHAASYWRRQYEEEAKKTSFLRAQLLWCAEKLTVPERHELKQRIQRGK